MALQTMQLETPDRLLTEAQVCDLLNIGPEYLRYRFIDAGYLSEPINLNHGTPKRPLNRWSAAEVSKLIERLKAGDLDSDS